MKGQTWIAYCRERRFLMAPFFLVLALGFYFDLQGKLALFYALLEQEKNQAQELAEKEQAFRQTRPLAARLQQLRGEKSKIPLLRQVIQAAAMNRCELAAVQVALKSSEGAADKASPVQNRLFIQLRLYANYASFYRFLASLLREGLPLQADHFSMQEEGERLEILLRLSAFPWAAEMADPAQAASLPFSPTCCAHDPFHDAPESLVAEGLVNPPPLERFPLQELRYVGYLSQNGESAALILLPDGRCYDLVPGALVGREAWRVREIHPPYLTLVDAAEKQRLRWWRAG